jgi:hypothetical protein
VAVVGVIEGVSRSEDGSVIVAAVHSLEGVEARATRDDGPCRGDESSIGPESVVDGFRRPIMASKVVEHRAIEIIISHWYGVINELGGGVSVQVPAAHRGDTITGWLFVRVGFSERGQG